MAEQKWILVEWINQDNSANPSYGVIKSKNIIESGDEEESDIVYVRNKYGNSASKARILMIGDIKYELQAQKALLERRDRQVQNVLTMCMKTIREVKSEPSPQILNYRRSTSTQMKRAQTDTTSSDDEESSSISLPRHEVTREQKPKIKRHSLVCSTPILKGPQKPSFDQATQTEQPNANEVKLHLDHVAKKVKDLYAQFLELTADIADYVTDQSEAESTEEEREIKEDSEYDASEVRKMAAHTTNTEDRIGTEPLGLGSVSVPSRLLRAINWSSYSSATRQLLQAVFSRKVLATHSLTGKSSPAFSNKPAKRQLNPTIVNDIVQTVTERCGVPGRLVRNCITIKCTDEAKLYRKRQHLRQSALEAMENMSTPPPLSPLSNNTSSADEPMAVG